MAPEKALSPRRALGTPERARVMQPLCPHGPPNPLASAVAACRRAPQCELSILLPPLAVSGRRGATIVGGVTFTALACVGSHMRSVGGLKV